MADVAGGGGAPRPKIDTTVPHSARIWNYWLGGKDHYEVDRIAGKEYEQAFPAVVDVARYSRYFLVRAVRSLASEFGVRQFLDVGTGLPTVDNTHEVAQRVAPDARIVYVDNDPLVLVHARALLTSTPEGACDYLDADLREPETILAGAERTLDFTRPVALTLIETMGHVTDDEEARAIVRRLVAGLPPGSYLVMSDGTTVMPKALADAQQDYDDTGAVPYRIRRPEQVAAFFEGLDLVEPGLVPCMQWRPDVAPVGPAPEVEPVCGVAKKP